MSTVKNKSTIFLSMPEEALKELRKVLFMHGLSPQEFLSFVAERVAMRDDRTQALIHEIKHQKKEQLREGGLDKKQISAEALYAAIEQNLDRK